MTTPESIVYQFPPLPEIAVPQLQTTKFDVGSAIETYITNILHLPSSELFSENCKELNQLREQLRSKPELQQDEFILYVNYYTLLTGTIKNIDVSRQGVFNPAKMSFTWQSVTLPDVDFDLVCFGYNIIVGVLKNVAHIPITNSKDAHTVVDLLKGCKAVYEKIIDRYSDSFSSVLELSKITILKSYIDFYLQYALIQNSVISSKYSFLLLGKLAEGLRLRLTKFQPPQPDIESYLNAVALISLSIGYSTETNSELNISTRYGIAVYFGRQAMLLQPTNKRGKQVTSIITPLLQQFQPRLAEIEKHNQTIYNQPVPKFLEVPSKNLPDNLKMDWKPTVQAISYDAGIAEHVRSSIQEKTAALFQMQKQAVETCNAISQFYPSLQETAIDQQTTKLYQIRTLFQDEYRQMVSFFNSGAGSRYPNLQEQFYSIQRLITQGQDSDLFYETKLASAKSTMEPIKQMLTQVQQEIMPQLNSYSQMINDLGKEVQTSMGASDVQVVVEANRRFNETFLTLQSELSRILQNLDNMVMRGRTLSEQLLPAFLHELEEVTTGFTNATKFYTDLVATLQKMKSKIVNA